MAGEVIASADVAVVGAGIVGGFIARELHSIGISVVLVDPRSPGQGVTAEGMGHLVVLDDSPTQLALTDYSVRLWREIAPHLPKEVEFRPTGTLWVAESEDRELLESKAGVLATSGVPAQVWDQARLRQEEPMLSRSLAGAVWTPGDAVIYAPTAASWAARSIPRIPATATAISNQGLETTLGRIQTERVVVAAGNGSHRLLAGLEMRPRKGHLAITPRGYRVSDRQVVELGYMRSAHGTDEDSVAFNIQPRATGQVLIGSSRQFGKTDRSIDRSILSRMLDRARQFVPAFDQIPILRAWTGFRPTVADGKPRIGPVDGSPQVLVATGHEGFGITAATATAKLIAHHIAGAPCAIDPVPYLPLGVRVA